MSEEKRGCFRQLLEHDYRVAGLVQAVIADAVDDMFQPPAAA